MAAAEQGSCGHLVLAFLSWAEWCDSFASFRPRGGHRRLERDVELAGVERSVEAARRQFVLIVMPGQVPDEG